MAIASSLLRNGMLAVLIVASTTQSTVAADHQSVDMYKKLFAECSSSNVEHMHFFTAFNGLWPVPANFVLLDATNHQLEYYDNAAPWTPATAGSRVFYGPRQYLEKRWPALFARAPKPSPDVCFLQVARHEATREFGSTVVVVSSDRHHVLLVGPIAEAAQEALQCYAMTVRSMLRSCE